MQTNARSAAEKPEPFLKWAGGKRWIARAVADLLETDTGRHIEPFAGSAACFFSSSAPRGLLADTNGELVNTFRTVRDHPEELIRRLSRLDLDITTYAKIRRIPRRSKIGRAVRFLYLNRTAFNGLYRVNRQGHFNVPFGCKPNTVVCDGNGIRASSKRLRGAVFDTADFAKTLNRAKLADSIFLDPPYTVRHNTNCFRRYNEHIFSWGDQVRLAELSVKLAEDGYRIVLTNAMHADVLKLYPGNLFLSFAVERPTNMASITGSRGRCVELLLISHGVGYTRQEAKDLLSEEFGYEVKLARRS